MFNFQREKQLTWSGPKGEQKPCSDHCYMAISMEGQVEEDFSVSNWKLLEKELYLKGVEMFGRNRYESLLFFTLHIKHRRTTTAEMSILIIF